MRNSGSVTECLGDLSCLPFANASLSDNTCGICLGDFNLPGAQELLYILARHIELFMC